MSFGNVKREMLRKETMMPRKAKARLLYSTVSTSERVAGLGVKGALIFTWLLAHCDDQGRYAGSAKRIKAEVVPMLDDISVEDVEKALEDMKKAKPPLILQYSDDRYGELIQIADWWEFQNGLRFRNPSRHPPPEGWRDDVRQPPARDTEGKFISSGQRTRLEDGVMNMLQGRGGEDFDIKRLASELHQPQDAIAQVIEKLYRDRRIRAVDGETWQLVAPPFRSEGAHFDAVS
jgi:hypothetical protein